MTNPPTCDLHIPPHPKKYRQVRDRDAGMNKHPFKWRWICDWCEEFGRGYGPNGALSKRHEAKSILALHRKDDSERSQQLTLA